MYNIKEKFKKLYYTGALHIIIGTFMTKFVAFFGSIFVVRLLSKEEYGLISYVENIYSYALILAGLGLSNAILRFLIVAENEKKRKGYFKYIINNSILRNIIILFIMIIICQIVPFPENYSNAKVWIPVMALLLPFQDLLNDDLFTLRAFFKNKLYAYISLLVSVALISGRIIGALFGGIGGVFLSRVLINSVLSVWGYFWVKKSFFGNELEEKLDKKEKRDINVYSFQYMITNGFWSLFMLNDTLLLGMLLNSPSGLAEYKVAYVFPGNLSILATAIGVFVGPYFTKNENNFKWIRQNYKKVFLCSAVVVGITALMIGILAKPLVLLIYGYEYLNIINLMRMLLLAAFINSGLRYATANLLAAMGEIKYNMIISGIGIVSQFVLDLILIPRLGTYAVAISNCIVCLFMAIALFGIFYKKYYSQK